MNTLTIEELKQWKADLFELCEKLKGKTDAISNAMRIVSCENISQIQSELIRRNAL